ncbi:hypothetical protein [Methylocella sp.]|uniref:hypothetical protein n=1 Tax=Methylocella sp. TaxID=1978226 RepID=UPI0037843471
MARALTAYLERSRVPDRASLQKALDALKLKIVLDEAYAPFKSVSYLPCTFDGEDAGFDIRFEDAPAEPPASVREEIGARDAAVLLRWGGDPREEACAMAVCAALARDFGALTHDPKKDRLASADELIRKAKAAAEQL